MNSKSSDTSDPDLGILTVRKQLCIPRGPIQSVLQVTPGHSRSLQVSAPCGLGKLIRVLNVGLSISGAKILGSGTTGHGSTSVGQSIQSLPCLPILAASIPLDGSGRSETRPRTLSLSVSVSDLSCRV